MKRKSILIALIAVLASGCSNWAGTELYVGIRNHNQNNNNQSFQYTPQEARERLANNSYMKGAR